MDEMFGAGGGDFIAWLQSNVDVVNEAIDLRLSGVRDDVPGAAADVVARDDAGASVVIQNLAGGEPDAGVGRLIRGMAATGAAAGVLVVPSPDAERASVVSWLNARTPFDFYLLQVEAYRIDDSAPAPVLTLVSGPEGEVSTAPGSLRDVPEEASSLETPAPADHPPDVAPPVEAPTEEPHPVEETAASGTEDPAPEDPVPNSETDQGLHPVEDEVPAAPTREESSSTYGMFEGYAAAPTTEAPAEEVSAEAAAVESAGDWSPDEGARELTEWFWGELLGRAEQRTRIHVGVAPSESRVLGASAGLAGLEYRYVIGDHEASVELRVDRGEGREGENETIFNALQATQDAIEYNYGGPLEWLRDSNGGSSRVRGVVGEGGLQDDGRWSETQDAMVDAMVRLERAMRPHVGRLQL